MVRLATLFFFPDVLMKDAFRWFTHDPTVYPEPMEFRPERYMGNDPAPDPRIYTFGFGRRVCPGRYVADNALFITIAQVLSVFDISTVEGEEPAVKVCLRDHRQERYADLL
jgi:cytochrome P450